MLSDKQFMTQRQPLSITATKRKPPYSILVVDDYLDNAALIRMYLSDCNFDIAYAENGQIAVEKVVADQPDLVLMDLQMPVMDGLEATRAIRRWEANTNRSPMPMLAVTASGVAEGIGGSLEAGCNEHLEKPIFRSILLDAIYRHMV